MGQIHYKLWLDGAVLGEWKDSADMHAEIPGYLEAHMEELHLLTLTAFTATRQRGSAPAFSVKGEEILSYLEDAEPVGE